MTLQKTDAELIDELETTAQEHLDRHIAAADDWESHDLVPWADGRNFAFLGGDDWDPEQSTLTEVEKLAATVGVLLADNLPAYHRDLAFAIRKDGTWWKLIGRWTAEEMRHALALRSFLMTTRAVDPVELERVRVDHMTLGYSAPTLHFIDMLAKFAFDETANAVRHRRAAELVTDQRLAAIFLRIAQDDELQAELFSNLVSDALDLVPDQAMRSIADCIAAFAIPSVDIPGMGNSTTALSEAGIYTDELQRDKVFTPLLEQWKIFDRSDFGDDGVAARDELKTLATA